MVWCDIVWCDMVWYGMIWYSMVCDMVWYGVLWYGMVWCDLVWCDSGIISRGHGKHKHWYSSAHSSSCCLRKQTLPVWEQPPDFLLGASSPCPGKVDSGRKIKATRVVLSLELLCFRGEHLHQPLVISPYGTLLLIIFLTQTWHISEAAVCCHQNV